MKAAAKKSTQPFDNFCPKYLRAVELVGRRWTGAIIRVLLGGTKRYSEIAAAVPGISDRLLAERLRELDDEGIVKRIVACGPPVRVEYALTESGAELEATIRALGAWADRWMTPRKK